MDASGSAPAAPTQPSWRSLIGSLVTGKDLSQAETAWAMDTIMAGEATDSQIAGFLVGLKAKGETVDELAGLVKGMVARATPISIPGEKLDIVGTGGDQQNTVNISSTAALVMAGAGARVVKHGNRAASSSSGSADVLEALGVRLDMSVARVAEAAEACGITFCFAQVFHPSFRFTAVPRKELAVPTIFNILGPLTNPARVQASAVGAADPRMAPLIAGVLAERGSRGLVFRGDDGLDELTITTTSRVWEVRGGQVVESVLDPADLGIPRAPLEHLRGGDAAHNAEVVRRTLAGDRGPVRDAVVLNAAAGLVAYDLEAEGPLLDRLAVAKRRAEEAIDSGAAARVLQAWVDFTRG
ncbi:anthranilate phosphoribosyltransferase [Sinomonas cellulolyticus]|uniref:Anthranilate phosphoribosyltransferase n=1 Tax=Sinomonas cellulolyticus TaxID=2801916 RepID=A0ABS1K0Q2_9MICC|nr:MULTISPECIES: anthranilate phosphoribosyltransferase [Sinomonas]MBL0705244.1 anthranilate phosphoribosyltransferase [Sinomonas cellulolyticus]